MIKEMTEKVSVGFSSAGKNGSAEVEIGGEYLKDEPAKYSHRLARLCAQLTMIGYDRFIPDDGEDKDRGAFIAFSALGFEKMKAYTATGIDEEDCIFASAPVIVNGEEYTLVTALFLGSYTKQWYTNFDSGLGETHKSFYAAGEFAFEKLKEFIGGLGADKKKLKLIVTGHSRGGAVANLIGAKIAATGIPAYKKNTYTYTFAAPAPTTDKERGGKKYSAIFNIVNEEDFVIRCMPREWGYGRYGMTFALPHKDNDADYENTLAAMRDYQCVYYPALPFSPFPDGAKTVNRLLDVLAACVCNINDYYNKNFEYLGRKISLHTFFSETLCAITGEAPDSEENKAGTNGLLLASLRRARCHVVFRATADFFVYYEGLAGATKSKISKQYFSLAHDISTYCAYLMAVGEDKLTDYPY